MYCINSLRFVSCNSFPSVEWYLHEYPNANFTMQVSYNLRLSEFINVAPWCTCLWDRERGRWRWSFYMKSAVHIHQALAVFRRTFAVQGVVPALICEPTVLEKLCFRVCGAGVDIDLWQASLVQFQRLC